MVIARVMFFRASAICSSFMEGSGVGSDDSALVHDRQQMVSAVKMLVSGCIMKNNNEAA